MKECIRPVVELAIKAGLRVFVAERGYYGFITDFQGDKLLNFGNSGLTLHFGGCYRAIDRAHHGSTVGSGWQIADGVWPENENDIMKLFEQAGQPPRWATQGFPVKLVNLETYLATYQSSSRFTEFKGE